MQTLVVDEREDKEKLRGKGVERVEGGELSVTESPTSNQKLFLALIVVFIIADSFRILSVLRKRIFIIFYVLAILL